MKEVLKEHVIRLSHEIGERNYIKYKELNLAKEYIYQEFESYGYKPEFQRYYLADREYSNIIAVKEGEGSKSETIIVGAHYDTVIGTPGADDNASGVACLLELAKISYHSQFKKTIKFIAFVNEEPPFFFSDEMGSRIYAKKAKEKGENIKAMISLESIGYFDEKRGSQQYPLGLKLFYPDKGNFIAVVGNMVSRDLVKKISRAITTNCNIPVQHFWGPASIVPAISLSDNWSFWVESYKGIMITDTAMYRNPNYHLPQDTYEKLDYLKLSKLTKGISLVIKTIASS
jgi:Zn-dependent M28 family amino/carboxypeptidase